MTLITQRLSDEFGPPTVLPGLRWSIPVRGGLRAPITVMIRETAGARAAEVWAFGLPAEHRGLLRIRIETSAQVEELIERIRLAHSLG